MCWSSHVDDNGACAQPSRRVFDDDDVDHADADHRPYKDPMPLYSTEQFTLKVARHLNSIRWSRSPFNIGQNINQSIGHWSTIIRVSVSNFTLVISNDSWIFLVFRTMRKFNRLGPRRRCGTLIKILTQHSVILNH